MRSLVAEAKRRRIQAEEQRIAEQQRQHPPAPPLPAGASHWDRLPAELHGMIIEASGPLTKLAVGAMTPEQLEAASSEEQEQAWEDAFATNWQGNLGLLPNTSLGVKSFMHINSRTMHTRVSELDFYDFKQGLTYCALVREWRDFIDVDRNPEYLASLATLAGALWMLRELIDERRTVKPSERLALAAASAGHLEVVKFLHERSPDGSWSSDLAAVSISNGQLDVAEWLLANRTEGCDPNRLDSVIAYGRPDSYVKMVVERGWMTVDARAVSRAAASRSIDMMQLLRAKGGDNVFTADAMDDAANNGVEMLKWLRHEFGFVPTTQALTNALYRDDVDVARWLLETFPDFAWDMRAAKYMLNSEEGTPKCALVLRNWAAQHDQTFDD
ncbi:hypothetical protein HK105_203464 [Polyrhizophydium stewartii]|uniref:Ankyrin repeat protein n=1 Tax=Polyrhizophydium stewartii TaxID=2732419 RepID=A0ABR4NBY2_9FUNG